MGVAFGRVNLELHMFELRSQCMLMSRWHLLSQESHDDFKPKRKSAPADLDDAVKMIEEQVGGVIRGGCVRVNMWYEDPLPVL